MEFIENKEKKNLKPTMIQGKEIYYHDLQSIEFTWTGRLDAQIANTFILESTQLIINAITLFEQGYFDCAYYSLRQSLEISTTMVYLTELNYTKQEEELKKWKSKSKFPMYNQMIGFLLKNKNVFADMSSKMGDYFEKLKIAKNSMNKFVHKQGFNTFYISRNHFLNNDSNNSKFIETFDKNIQICIGAVAVLRLAIDPFPILLRDEEMYLKTFDLMTIAYSDKFIEKYIGESYVELYKKTDIYKEYYTDISKEEKKYESVADVIKNQYIDINKIDEIISQKHLLRESDIVVITLVKVLPEISNVSCYNGLKLYFTNIKSNRKKMYWNSEEYFEFSKKFGEERNNIPYEEAFISVLNVNNEDYYIEHNKKFDENEIKLLRKMAKRSSI